MSVDTTPEPKTDLTLRREALLPTERSRGLGTVAVVCTMAGVASGLALATTLMAMQVADSMSTRGCPYRVVEAPEIQIVPTSGTHAFLGVHFDFDSVGIVIGDITPRSPAAEVGLHPGDHIVAVNGAIVRSSDDFEARIYTMHPGERVHLTVDRSGDQITMEPTLVAWPSNLHRSDLQRALDRRTRVVGQGQ
jgi:S1-C subfamily serine protease